MANSDDGSSKTYTDPIHSSEQDSISPSFYKNSQSSNSLNDLENSASGSTGIQHGTKAGDAASGNQGGSAAADQAADAENNPSRLYNPAGQGGNDKTAAAADFAKNMASGNKLKALKSAKKAGPLGVLLVMLIVLGALLMGSSSLAPFAIANEIIDEFNSSNVSVRLRSHVLLKYHLKKGNTPEYTKKKLAAQGIDVETDADGKEQLRFTDSDGKEHIVTADNFDDYRKNNTDFRKAYITASATWRGQSSGWFTKLASATLKRIGVSRNNLKDAKNNDGASAEERQKNLQEVVENAGDSDTDSKTARTDESDKDDDGNPTNANGDTDSDTPTRTSSLSDAKAKINTSVSKLSGGAGLAGGACSLLMAASAIKGIVYVSQHTEMLQIASVFLESVQKTQAGDGDAAMLNTFMEALTKLDDNGKSAMQSAGIAALFSGSSNSTTNYKNDSGVKLANSNNVITEAMTVGGVDVGSFGSNTYTECLAARAASSVVDIITTATGPFKMVLIAVDIGVQLAANVVIAAIVDVAAEAITANVVGNMFGENMGNYVISGAQSYLGSVHQGQGGAAGSADAVAEYQAAKQEVIAEEADYERSIYSPFDVSSQYTFLGSILNSLVPLATSVSYSSFSGTFSQVSSIISSSLISLTPAADAANLTNLMQETGDCPDLESVGATCDMYGNPIYVSDLSTIEDDPDDVKEEATINHDNLEKWQNYCEQRTSTLGTSDSEIIADLTNSDDIASQIIDVVPILGSLQEIKNVALETANLGWTTGQNCVDSSQNTNWDEMKWYQRYDEDQELIAQMNGEFASSSNSSSNADGDCPELGNQRTAMWDEASESDKQSFMQVVSEEDYSIAGVEGYMNQALAYSKLKGNTSNKLSYWLNNQCSAFRGGASCQGSHTITDEEQSWIDEALNGSNNIRFATGNATGGSSVGAGKIVCVWDGTKCQDVDYENTESGAACSTLSPSADFGECWGLDIAGSEDWAAQFESTCGTPLSSTDSTDPAETYELSNIIAYDPAEESSSDYYLAYDDDGNLSIQYYDDAISDADGDGYDDDYVNQIATYSGLTTAEVVEVLDLLYAEDDTNLTPAWPLATTTAPTTTTVDLTNDAPLSTAVATSNHQYFVTSPHTARTDLATITA